MGTCLLCKTTSPFIAGELSVCLRCIRENPKDAMPLARKAHARSRAAFGLPEEPPNDHGGVSCNLCVNECRIPENGIGYCGVRRNVGGKLEGVSPGEGKLSWYHDPLPTNCVADWVCPGGTGAGYPKFAHRPGPEAGYSNLAVFFHACSFNCLYCQNWQYRRETQKPATIPAEALAADVDDRTSCICYFGGDPAPQLPFSLKASRLALDRRKGGILRICWETNGSMCERLLDEMVEIAMASGGCIKFDLKAWNENVHVALTGVTNEKTLENLSRAAKEIGKRPVPPLLVASTLLVPGYVDEEEVKGIAGFLASLDPAIPYSLLAFHPHFYMSDLPRTPGDLARECLRAARDAGLANVRIGNVHLLT
ncbi:MAG: radical SAM protein [Deltaproteobacteria bacterium]|nr:radical SAM protein [Deltaproteobacteria bacterium]